MGMAVPSNYVYWNTASSPYQSIVPGTNNSVTTADGEIFPYGFSVLQSTYQQYQVYASKLSVKLLGIVDNTTGETTTGIAQVSLYPLSGPQGSNVSNVQTALARRTDDITKEPRAKQRIMRPMIGVSGPIERLNNYISTATQAGVSHQQYRDEINTAYNTSTPTGAPSVTPQYWALNFQNPIGNFTVGDSIYIEITGMYYYTMKFKQTLG